MLHREIVASVAFHLLNSSDHRVRTRTAMVLDVVMLRRCRVSQSILPVDRNFIWREYSIASPSPGHIESGLNVSRPQKRLNTMGTS
jgi:hypothetical protein